MRCKSKRMSITVKPEPIGGSEYTRWTIDATLPNQELTEAYDDYLEMMERIHELLLRFRRENAEWVKE